VWRTYNQRALGKVGWSQLLREVHMWSSSWVVRWELQFFMLNREHEARVAWHPQYIVQGETIGFGNEKSIGWEDVL